MTAQVPDFTINQIMEYDSLNFGYNPTSIGMVRLPFPLEREINLSENRQNRRTVAILRYPDNRMRHIPIVFLNEILQTPDKVLFFFERPGAVDSLVALILDTQGLTVAEFDAVMDWRDVWKEVLNGRQAVAGRDGRGSGTGAGIVP